MREGMVADLVPLTIHPLEQVRRSADIAAQYKERRRYMVRGKNVKNLGCVASIWAIVEGQDDLLVGVTETFDGIVRRL